MENIVEKLGFFDFFNSIIVGVFIIVGCFAISMQFRVGISEKVFLYLVNTTEVNLLFLVICIFSMALVAYILGMLCHEIFSIIDDKLDTFHTTISHLFKRDSCISNTKRRYHYANIAKDIFEKNGIDYPKTKHKNPGIVWDYELNNYFFTYCVYQVQIRGLDKKPEKLRTIEGLAKSFCVGTVLLLIMLLCAGLNSWNTNSLPTRLFLIEVISLIIVSIFFCVYRMKALKNRIRLTLSLFEAVYEKENMKIAKTK